MRIVLSQFVHPNNDIERAALPHGAEMFVQARSSGKWEPLPPEIRATAEGIVHFPPGTSVDGSPEDYPILGAIVRCGVGFDSLDLASWGHRGVAVFNVPDYGTSEVADHAIALMLALTRGTATYHERLRTDPVAGWSHLAAPAVRRLRDAVFGIVGLGRIGLAAALRARSFGMRLACYDPYLPSGMEIAAGAQRCRSLEDLMAISDVVSVHAPASEATIGLIGARAFAAAKQGLILVNTARGGLVDLDALHDALKSGRLAGAALDVLPTEPPDPTQKLIDAWRRREPWLEGRLTLSPHAAFYSPSSLHDMRTKGMETLVRFLESGDLTNCVNKHFLEKRNRA
jgi:lactate dehydrogenase-like 2-hydroxyacid dehydrogenase